MLKLILEAFISISGTAAASGIVYNNDELHIVSDNSNYLYSYNLAQQRLSKTALLDTEPMENISKANKMDLESITALNNGLMAYKEIVLFSSHDHQFIETIANRIIEVTPEGTIIDKQMSYDEYLEWKK